VIKHCHGRNSCSIKAEPKALEAPSCHLQHVLLKTTYACLIADNFLPKFVKKEINDSSSDKGIEVVEEISEKSKKEIYVPTPNVKLESDKKLQTQLDKDDSAAIEGEHVKVANSSINCPPTVQKQCLTLFTA